MRKKGSQYYILTGLLKLKRVFIQWSNVLGLSNMTKKKQRIVSIYDRYSFNVEVLDFYPEFYSYSHFSRTKDIDHVFIFNENNIATNFEKMSGKIDVFFTCYYALLLYNEYISSNNKTTLNRFFDHINFIIRHIEVFEGEVFYQFKEDVTLFDIKSPWKSGLMQSVLASCFSRAYNESQDSKFLTLAKGSIDIMLKPPLKKEFPNGDPWIEEYPSDPPSFALNSFIFSIIAIGEYASITQDEYYLDQFRLMINSLVNNLHKYTYGAHYRHNLVYWSLCNIDYQGLFVSQWYHLYKMTNHPFFLDLYEKDNRNINWEIFYSFYQIPFKVKIKR